MSDTVWIVLIIVLAIVLILVIFRKQLSRFFVKADQGGIEAELQTHEAQSSPPSTSQASVTISGNRQIGKKNEIGVAQSSVNVADNLQAGTDQKIDVKPDPSQDSTPA